MRSFFPDLTIATQSLQVYRHRQSNHYTESKMQLLDSSWTHLKMLDHVTQALRQLHWLPIMQRVNYKLCTLMHSIHTGQCPKYLADTVRAVAINPSRPGLRSSSTAHYQKPRCRSAVGERAVSYAGPLAWNALPSSLHNIHDHKQFRKRLKP